MSSTVSYNLESPTVALDDVFFPSVVVCNMNALRKSFIQTLIEDPAIKNLTTFDELLLLVNSYYIRGTKLELSPKEELITKTIIESEAYNRLYEQFIESAVNEDQIPDFSNVYVAKYHSLMEIEEEERFDAQYKLAFILEVATQFRAKEVLINVQFNGAGINHDGGGFATDVSDTCHWLTPFVKEPGDFQDLRTMVTFARNGLNNGLQLLIDAEAYDYASSQFGSEGFIVSILHQLDIPIMKNTGININTGQASQIVVVPQLMNTSLAAKRRFTPVERQCYFEEEIFLRHFPPSFSFR